MMSVTTRSEAIRGVREQGEKITPCTECGHITHVIAHNYDAFSTDTKHERWGTLCVDCHRKAHES